MLIFISSLHSWGGARTRKCNFYLCPSQLNFWLFGCTSSAAFEAAALTSVASVEECDDSCLHHSDNTYTETICSTLTLVLWLYTYCRCFGFCCFFFIFAELRVKHEQFILNIRKEVVYSHDKKCTAGKTRIYISNMWIHYCKRSEPCMGYYRCCTCKRKP